MKKIALVLAVSITIIACNNNKTTENAAPVKPETSMPTQAPMATKDSSSGFTANMVDSSKDFICGMPVSAGIADTAHYKGKVYGFCSSECKAEFAQAPSKYIATK
ncbi:MAG: YHS domain-containing protein [Ferruginibacter sp.]